MPLLASLLLSNGVLIARTKMCYHGIVELE